MAAKASEDAGDAKALLAAETTDKRNGETAAEITEVVELSAAVALDTSDETLAATTNTEDLTA